MNAQEARRTASKMHNKAEEIILKIREEAIKGRFETYWYEQISDFDRSSLTNLGYTVGQEQSDGRNGILTKISW